MALVHIKKKIERGMFLGITKWQTLVLVAVEMGLKQSSLIAVCTLKLIERKSYLLSVFMLIY